MKHWRPGTEWPQLLVDTCWSKLLVATSSNTLLQSVAAHVLHGAFSCSVRALAGWSEPG